MPRAAPARPRAERCLPARILLALSEGGEPVGLEVPSALLRPLVPRPPGIGIAEARPGIEQHQRPDHLGMGEVEGERHVAAERETADDCALDAAMAQKRRHVLDGQRLGIGRGILGGVGLAVAAHVPDDDPVAWGEGGDLRVPRPAGGYSRGSAGWRGRARDPHNRS